MFSETSEEICSILKIKVSKMAFLKDILE